MFSGLKAMLLSSRKARRRFWPAALAGKYHVYLGMALATCNPSNAKPLENKMVLVQPNGDFAWQYYKAHPCAGRGSRHQSYQRRQAAQPGYAVRMG